MPKADTPKRTEADMLTLLRKRHSRVGNGGSGEWAFLTHVRDEAGFSSTRTLDAVALGLWPSRGFELHGFEVKVSRSDWLRELADPAKAERFIERLDRFWIVAAEGVAKPGEMPHGWGLLVAQGDSLRAAVQAEKIPHTPEERLISRSWLVCLLRAAGAVPKSSPADIQKAHDDGYALGVSTAKRAGSDWELMYREGQDKLNALREQVQAFQRAAGFSLSEYHDQTAERATQIGGIVKAAISGDRSIEANLSRVYRMAGELENAAAHLRGIVEPPVLREAS